MQTVKFPIKESVLSPQKAFKKSLGDPARQAAPKTVSGPPALRTFANISVDGVKDMQPPELLSRVQNHVKMTYTVRQMRRNDTTASVQLESQKEIILNLMETEGLKVLLENFPMEVYRVPLKAKKLMRQTRQHLDSDHGDQGVDDGSNSRTNRKKINMCV